MSKNQCWVFWDRLEFIKLVFRTFSVGNLYAEFYDTNEWTRSISVCDHFFDNLKFISLKKNENIKAIFSKYRLNTKDTIGRGDVTKDVIFQNRHGGFRSNFSRMYRIANKCKLLFRNKCHKKKKKKMSPNAVITNFIQWNTIYN